MSIGYKSNMDHLIKQLSVINLYFKARLSVKNAFDMLKKAYGESCLKNICLRSIWSGSR